MKKTSQARYQEGEARIIPLLKPRGGPHYRFEVRYKSGGIINRKFFRRRGEAEQWLAAWEDEVSQHGSTQPLTPDERATVLATRQECQALNTTLRTALLEGLAAIRHRQVSATVRELVAFRLETMEREGLSQVHQTQTRLRLERFAADHGEEPVPLMTAERINDWLVSLAVAPLTVRHYRAALHALFAEGVRRRILEANPVAHALRPKVAEHEVEIFSPEEAAALLDMVDEDLLPVVALGLFAGLRVSEVVRLDWADIDRRERYVRVRSGKTSKSRRIVPICDTLDAWLENGQGRVCERPDPLYYFRRDWLATGRKWPKNGLRHSFASYHLAAHQNVSLLAEQLGNSPEIIRRHYAQVVTASQAAKFWAIRPAQEAGNVLRMQG